MVPWSHLRQPSSGWVSTVLNSEFTHFNLVIHLSKSQQSAFRLCTFCKVPLFRLSFMNPVDCIYVEWSHFELPETFFLCSLRIWSSTWHSRQKATGMSFSCRCGLFGFWWGETFCASNSLEFGSCFMPSWHDLTTVPVQGIIARHLRQLGTESCMWLWIISRDYGWRVT